MFALFFAVVLFIALYFFLPNCTDSLFLHFAIFSSVSHPRLQRLLVPSLCFFLRSMSAYVLLVGPDTFFAVLICFFTVLLLNSAIGFFAV